MDTSLLVIALNHPELIDKLDVGLREDALGVLVDSPHWPKAIEGRLIIDEESETQIEQRARSILRSLVKVDLTSKKFLDFGTGSSRCWKFADSASVSVGYDIQEHDGVLTDLDEVRRKGPYDIVLLYDVIDHLQKNGKLCTIKEAIEALRVIPTLMTQNARVVVRCHPWVARHGTHAYLDENKAFIHYEKEIGVPTIKIVTPRFTYMKMFSEIGLEIVDEKVTSQPVEALFHDQAFARWGELYPEGNREKYLYIMAICYIDYTLKLT